MGRIIYIDLICLHKVWGKESRVSSQLLGSERRTPPTVMLFACSSHSAGHGQGLFLEASKGREQKPLLTGQ